MPVSLQEDDFAGLTFEYQCDVHLGVRSVRDAQQKVDPCGQLRLRYRSS
jgi:hypothetical protein